MTQTTVTEPAAIGAGVPFLPGRTVELVVTPFGDRGIVADVTTDGQTCTVKFGAGDLRADDFREVPALHLRAVTPDRPRLASDDLVVGALGEKLAERAGQLEGFHQGHNNGRTAFTEAARGLLGDIDVRTFAAKHSRCGYTFVETSAGEARTDRAAYEDGDRLVECAFYVDGPGSPFCGVHRPLVEAGNLPSIFHPGVTEAEREASRGRGELVRRAPLVAPGAEAAPVLTEVERHAIALDHLVGEIRGVLIRRLSASDSPVTPADSDGPGVSGRLLYALIEQLFASRGERVPGSMYWEALAYGVRRGLLVFHTGPRYSPAPDFSAHAAEVAK